MIPRPSSLPQSSMQKREAYHHHSPAITRKRNIISEHSDPQKEPKHGHEPHSLHEETPVKGPHDPKIINPKMASDIAYWSHDLRITGDQLHEAIRVHGTHVDRIRAVLHPR